MKNNLHQLDTQFAPVKPKKHSGAATNGLLPSVRLVFLLIAGTMFSGCVALKDKQVHLKETFFGLQVTTPGSSGAATKFQLGLARSDYESNPVRTNKIYAAPFGSRVHEDVIGTHQVADEIIIMGDDVTVPAIALPQAAAEESALKLQSVPAPQPKKIP